MRIRKQLISVIFMFVFLCVSVMPIQASAAKLNKKSVNVYAGKTVQLKVTGVAKKNVIWNSNNPAVAKVTAKGKVTGVKKGNAVISARVSGKTYQCKVTVKQKRVKAKSISLNRTIYFTMPGTTWTPKVTIKPDNTTEKSVIWKSSDPSVVKVSRNGVVTALADGKAEITAITGDGSKKKASCTVFVLMLSPSQAPEDVATSSSRNRESELARRFLNLLQKYSSRVELDTKNGITWAYSNSGAGVTWKSALNKAKSKRISYCNCALLARWGLRDLGLLDSKNFWGIEGGKILFRANTKEQLLKHCRIIRAYKTPYRLLQEGNLLPGDICTWVEFGHTNIYAGDGLWYDAGRSGNTGGYRDGRFVFYTFGPAPTINLSGPRVGYIIRLIQ